MSETALRSLDEQLNNESTPLAQRFRALFTLKSIGSHEAIEIISKGFDGKSALLGHELAYCLGQIKDPYALPQLTRVLENEQEHPMVRHEAAEAIGAISDLSGLPVLRKYLDHPERAIRETAEIAVAKIEFDNSDAGQKNRKEQSQGHEMYTTIDPAPAFDKESQFVQNASKKAGETVRDLEKILLDESLPLFERYRAMFALRNDGSKEAVLALARGFDDQSALFRHEIAYIFGQMTSPHSVPSLITVVQKETEDEMVRHEAAEALGSIADEQCLPVLIELSKKQGVPRVVRESAEVALDMYEYEKSGQLHYAPTLASTQVAAA